MFLLFLFFVVGGAGFFNFFWIYTLFIGALIGTIKNIVVISEPLLCYNCKKD